jgi:non-reducing end alpha-L-arabinofuranosidase
MGEKIGIDIGGAYELATVIAVGKAATQTTLSAAAAAGATNIQLAASLNMTAGDTLTLGAGRRKELVRILNVGSPGAGGTGVDLAAPLRFDHMSGADVSDLGTGISFSPPTRFPHSSGDAVQALGSGITLDRRVARNHPYGAAVVNSADKTSGYQGPPAPNQWFGGTLSPRAGSIALVDVGGVIVDAMVYGSQQSSSSANGTIATPEIARLEADQGKGGCIVVVPSNSSGAGRSRGRFPDGLDTDSNCTDFLVQPATTLSAAAVAGAANIKVASVADFGAGQTIMIDTGASLETAVIATVGTAGATTVSGGANVGATVLNVASAAGFAAGQTISVDGGANQETAVVVSTTGGRGGATITVGASLKFAHAAGAQVSGSGITIAAALSRAHAAGTQVASSVPTPGAPNQYYRRPAQ